MTHVTSSERDRSVSSSRQLPPFSALPIQDPGPPLNAWGLFGPDDEYGRLNLIDTAAVKRGRDAIKHGIAVNLK